MNLEFDDDNLAEIRFIENGVERNYKGTIGGFFDSHGNSRLLELTFLFEGEKKWNLRKVIREIGERLRTMTRDQPKALSYPNLKPTLSRPRWS